MQKKYRLYYEYEPNDQLIEMVTKLRRDGTLLLSEISNLSKKVDKNKIHEKGNYKNGFREGKWEVWYENENISEWGSYINGKKEGMWVSRAENGTTFKGNYVKGQKVGVWRKIKGVGDKSELFAFPFVTAPLNFSLLSFCCN